MRLRIVPLLLALAALGGCGYAGAKYRVSGDGLRYPVSFSPTLHDADGHPAFLGETLRPLGDFAVRRASVGFLYGMTGTAVDLSEDINREVERLGGEGVVRLSFRTSNCASSWLFPLTFLPFYPGCQDLEASGTVVIRVAPGEPSKGGTR